MNYEKNKKNANKKKENKTVVFQFSHFVLHIFFEIRD